MNLKYSRCTGLIISSCELCTFSDGVHECRKEEETDFDFKEEMNDMKNLN